MAAQPIVLATPTTTGKYKDTTDEFYVRSDRKNGLAWASNFWPFVSRNARTAVQVLADSPDNVDMPAFPETTPFSLSGSVRVRWVDAHHAETGIEYEETFAYPKWGFASAEHAFQTLKWSISAQMLYHVADTWLGAAEGITRADVATRTEAIANGYAVRGGACLRGADSVRVVDTAQLAKRANTRARSEAKAIWNAINRDSPAKTCGQGIFIDAWDAGLRDQVMKDILAAKFAAGTDLAAWLCHTGDAELRELPSRGGGDHWTYGTAARAHNKLGELLMERRAELLAM